MRLLQCRQTLRHKPNSESQVDVPVACQVMAGVRTWRQAVRPPVCECRSYSSTGAW